MMEKSKKALLLTLALVFIGMFLIASVFATKVYTGNVYHASPSVVQTYKSYDNNEIVNTPVKTIQAKQIQTRPVQTYYLNKHEDSCDKSYYYDCNYDSTYDWNYDPYYYYDQAYNKKPVSTIHYTQYGIEKTRDNLFGDYVKDYSVYVTNRGETGRYFTVTYNLENKRGKEFSQSVTKYLKAGEKRKFDYKDIQFEKNEILDWNYDIIPEQY
jgi:hypothetical protein